MLSHLLRARPPPPLPRAHAAHSPGPDPGAARPPCSLEGHPSLPGTPGPPPQQSPVLRPQEQPAPSTPASPAARAACLPWPQDRRAAQCGLGPVTHSTSQGLSPDPRLQPSVQVHVLSVACTDTPKCTCTPADALTAPAPEAPALHTAPPAAIPMQEHTACVGLTRQRHTCRPAHPWSHSAAR